MWPRKVPLEYGIAVLCVALMTALHELLVPWLGRQHNVQFMLCAVIIALATAGTGPAILTAVLAFGVSQSEFVEGGWPGLLQANNVSSALLYALVCALLITLGSWHERRARREREAHARDVQMLELVTDGFFVVDRQWRFAHVNNAALRFFGKTRQEVLGQVIWELFPLIVGTPLETLFRDVDRAGQARQSELLLPVSNRWLDMQAVPTGDGIMGVFTDITERVRAELALREADHRKDEFLATLAHELRNPLAPILNSVQLLGSETPARANARSIIDRQVRHMARLVDDLLDVSRITLGRINLRRERAGVALIVSHAVEASRPLIDAAGHELKVVLPPTPLYVEVDVVRLTQALLNLLNNAAKYTPTGGHIALTACAQDGQALIAVSDTGVGIPGAMLPRIFEMFAQVDQSLERTQGGLGIGLTLAGKLVGLHGGTLVAHSEGLGHGSRFEIRIPLAAAAPGTQPLTTSAPVHAPQIGRRVLVVDDNVDAAESLSLLLQADGHQTELAHDGLAAVEATARFAPDIVLLDIGLPGLNGYEAARRMRSPGSSRPRLVAVTGWGQQQDRLLAAQAGFDMHLTKPVDPAVIMALARDPDTPALQAYAL
jgi:PAS domain S-box-containing protein